MEADVLFLLYLAVRQSTFLPTISVLDREGSTGPWQGDIHDTARHGSPPPPNNYYFTSISHFLFFPVICERKSPVRVQPEMNVLCRNTVRCHTKYSSTAERGAPKTLTRGKGKSNEYSITDRITFTFFFSPPQIFL